MKSAANFSEQLKSTLSAVTSDIIEHLPGIVGALALVIVGWLLARLVRFAATRLLNVLNRFLERVLTGRTRAVVRFSSGMSRLVAGILFWITLFIFVTAALRIAGLSGIATWLERIVDYLPAMMTGGLIILAGYVLGALLKDVTLTAARSAELAQAELFSRLVQVITVVTALIIGMDQVGVDVTFLTIILAVTTAALLAGFALAFGLGARTLVSNLIAAHYTRELVAPGQKVRIGEWEGSILDVSVTTVIIDTPEGRVSIPAKLCQEQAVTLIMADSDNE